MFFTSTLHLSATLQKYAAGHSETLVLTYNIIQQYRGADKSLARPTSQCILFDGLNISFDASLVIYINGANIPLIMIINT